MSIIGPRPALWNQYDLIEERDKYDANGIPVGLTGWAQINGRDELPIEIKAKLDGDYVRRMLVENDYYLATIHRAENTDNLEKLSIILKAFSELDKPVLLPLHPRTKKLMKKLDIELKNVMVIQPVGYLLMLYLTSKAFMVITDSGGLQKEAYFLKTPCTTLRDQTEWIETLNNSWNVLSSISLKEIKSKVQRELICFSHAQVQSFGGGKAAIKICEAINSGRSEK